MEARIAVLVDGDNLSAGLAEEILAQATRRGRADIVRIYCDAKSSGWTGVAECRLVHSGSGKNAADIVLAIEAMELALTTDLDGFVIASSDRDHSHIAQRLRERGLTVIGIGEEKSPEQFRQSCTDFAVIGAPKPKPKPKPTPVPVLAKVSNETPLEQKIRAVIASHAESNAGLKLTDLAMRMGRDYQVRISTLSEKTWRAYFLARPEMFAVGPKGPDAMVRYLPAGFRAVA